MATNQEMINALAEGFANYDPQIEQIRAITDDQRIIRDIILGRYPLPIGEELRKLLSSDYEEPGMHRLFQVFKTLERAMQFLAFIMIIQLIEEKKNLPDIKIPDHFYRDFEKRFLLPTAGNYYWFIRCIGDIFTDNGIKPFVHELEPVLNTVFYKKFDMYIPERNQLVHFLKSTEQSEIIQKCQVYTDALAEILAELACLANYCLYTVENIKVIKPKWKDAKFWHRIVIKTTSPGAEDPMLEDFMDSMCVLLVRKVQTGIGNYLNMSPLLFDSRVDVKPSQEKFKPLVLDTYIYSGYKNKRKLTYIGIHSSSADLMENLTEMDDTGFVFYEQLKSEIDYILETFSVSHVHEEPAI